MIDGCTLVIRDHLTDSIGRKLIMLDGLDAVPWARLQHAYGSAHDVPDLIRGLRSPELAVRRRARWELFGNIVHQGTRYSSSAHAVPFLLELLADPETPEPDGIVALLQYLAFGDVDLPGDGHPDNTNAVDLAAHEAVRAGVPRFHAMLTHDDARVRAAAARILGWFGEEAAASVPALIAAMVDPEAPVRATAALALGVLGAGEPAARHALTAALTDPGEPVRWCAAIALGRLPDSGADVVAELLACVARPVGSPEGLPNLEDDELAMYAYATLRRLDEVGTDALLDALIVRLSPATRAAVDPTPAVITEQAVMWTTSALALAFPVGGLDGGTPFEALDQRRQRLLRTLVESPAAWSGTELMPIENDFGAYDGPLVGRYIAHLSVPAASARSSSARQSRCTT